MTEITAMANFIGLSEVLTGFNASMLAPSLDPINIKTTYFEEWQRRVAADTGDATLALQILSSFADLNGDNKPKQVIGEALLANAFYEQPCRQLIYLWYMGAWPTVIQGDDATRGSTVFDTLSAESYTAGLVWQVMQAHPMGDSNYRYGYWAATPEPLNEYTGNKGD